MFLQKLCLFGHLHENLYLLKHSYIIHFQKKRKEEDENQSSSKQAEEKKTTDKPKEMVRNTRTQKITSNSRYYLEGNIHFLIVRVTNFVHN